MTDDLCKRLSDEQIEQYLRNADAAEAAGCFAPRVIRQLRADLAAANACIRDAGSFWSQQSWLDKHRVAYDRAVAVQESPPDAR